MFGLLSAFPLTPLDGETVDEPGFAAMIERIAAAGADSIGALGSTGSYAYFDRAQRARLAQVAVRAAGNVPVLIGIGAISTREVLQVAEDAQRAGAAAVLLAPVSYQQLTEDEVFALYEEVTGELSIPLCVYDNPTTTRFTFTDELRARVAQLPGVASIKLPGVPAEVEEARSWLNRLRSAVPEHLTLGVSGDAHAMRGLQAGCDTWYSVTAGVLPKTCVALTTAVQRGDPDQVAAINAQLQPLWALIATYGSLRVVAALAEQLGLVVRAGVPRPVRDLPPTGQRQVADLLAAGGDAWE